MSKLALVYWNAFGLQPISEYKFHPKRKWRFDYAWPHLKIAAEIEGGIWTNGAHVRGKHFMSDLEKYNTAAKLGWRVFRFVPQQLNNGGAQLFMAEVLKGAIMNICSRNHDEIVFDGNHCPFCIYIDEKETEIRGILSDHSKMVNETP